MTERMADLRLAINRRTVDLKQVMDDRNPAMDDRTIDRKQAMECRSVSRQLAEMV